MFVYINQVVPSTFFYLTPMYKGKCEKIVLTFLRVSAYTFVSPWPSTLEAFRWRDVCDSGQKQLNLYQNRPGKA